LFFIPIITYHIPLHQNNKAPKINATTNPAISVLYLVIILFAFALVTASPNIIIIVYLL
jgi:hypothetical protein